MGDKIDVYVKVEVPSSESLSESMNNWTSTGLAQYKTQVFEDADNAKFNRRLVVPCSEESLKSGQGFVLSIMDADKLSDDDIKVCSRPEFQSAFVDFDLLASGYGHGRVPRANGARHHAH